MATFKDWLNAKFIAWEKAQGRKQSYYAFARYLEVSQSALAQWMVGNGEPGGEDLPLLAQKLGLELYDLLGLPRPRGERPVQMVSAAYLPPDIRQRLANAINEADQAVRQARVAPESAEARQMTLAILAKWGFLDQGDPRR